MKPSMLVLGLALSLLQASQQAEEPPAGPQVARPAPVFRLNDQKGRAVTVGEKGRRWCVVAFFPKAMTPG